MAGDDSTLGSAIEEAQRKAEWDQRWLAHIELHRAAEKAHEDVHRSLVADGDRTITAHEREHFVHDEAHRREHTMTDTAISKASESMDKRLEGMNEFRSALRDQAASFVRMETYTALVDRVIAIEKLDIKGEGRTIGQGVVIAAIVGTVAFIATLLGIVAVIANLAAHP